MISVVKSSRVLHRSVQTLLRENRQLMSTQYATKEFEEVKFNVPWGHISGKWYGPKHTRPIIGLHGWQDNAGTFDTLAPLLPNHVGFLAIDLPGHGLSSWLPNGCSYHSVDYVTFLFELMQEFRWDKISFICHSMSSINAFVFCSLFPDKCDMLIGLDILKPLIRSKERVINALVNRVLAFHKYDKRNQSKREPPCYEYDQIVERLHEGTGKSVSKECCHFLLKRNIKPSIHEPHKYYFSRDNRLKATMICILPEDVVMEMALRITCPHLFIKASGGPYYENKAYYDEVINLLKQKPTFEFHQVQGTHHVHLNEPHKVAEILNPFIKKHRPN